MSASSTMYRMKPLFEMDKVEVSTDMYRIRNIHDSDTSGVVCNGTAEEDDSYINFIEGRQEEILKRLKELRELLSAPIIPSGPSPKIEPTSASSSTRTMTAQSVDLSKCGISQDIVLNVNPSQLPYSLLGLAKLWDGALLVKISCHSHSSLRTLPKSALDFQEKLTAIPSIAGETSAVLNIRLVWKEVDSDSILIISPTKSVPVYGEVNFLRFLNSCIVGKLEPIEQTLLDDKLDSCYSLSVDASKSNVQQQVQNIFSNLKTSQWLSGKNPSVLDLAAWSVVTRQSKSITLDSKGKQWFESANKMFS